MYMHIFVNFHNTPWPEGIHRRTATAVACTLPSRTLFKFKFNSNGKYRCIFEVVVVVAVTITIWWLRFENIVLYLCYDSMFGWTRVWEPAEIYMCSYVVGCWTFALSRWRSWYSKICDESCVCVGMLCV